MNSIIIQLIGFIGLFFVVLSFQKNKRSFTLVTQIIAAFFFTIHLGLLGAWTGAAMNIVAGIRGSIYNLRKSKKWINNPILPYLFVLIFWLAGIFTWEGYHSLLPMFSVTLECFALWTLNTKKMRWLFLFARPTWIIYNVMVGSVAGLATEVFIVSSLIIAIVRFDFLKKRVK